MLKNVDALKALYVALGGTAADVADVNKIPDMIMEIATVAGEVFTAATTKELPAVSKTNEGAVLKVNSSGKWAIGTDETTSG